MFSGNIFPHLYKFKITYLCLLFMICKIHRNNKYSDLMCLLKSNTILLHLLGLQQGGGMGRVGVWFSFLFGFFSESNVLTMYFFFLLIQVVLSIEVPANCS